MSHALDRFAAELDALERAWHVLGRGGGGNPYHDAEGKFTSGPGGGSGGVAKEGRLDRRRRLRRRLRRRHKAERRALVAKQRERHAKHREYYARRKASLARQHGHELAKMDAEHAREIAVMEKRREKERAREAVQKDKGKVTGEQVAKWEAEHAKAVASIKEINADIRKQRQEWHAAERHELREERKGAAQAIRERGARERKAMLKSQREEREGYGFKPRTDRSFSEGWGVSRAVDVPDRPGHRLGAGRVHKAGSAGSILRHCLRDRGLSGAWRSGGLTGEQALELLAAIRDYGRAWMHHEAMQLIRHHGRKVDANGRGLAGGGGDIVPGLSAPGRGTLDRTTDCGQRGDPGPPGEGEVLRALTAVMRHHVGRFFDRARGFVRELILAGAMALSGPGELTADDLAEADRATQVQVAYLDRFRLEMEARAPAELSEGPAEGAMTAAEFAARAELYGASVWSAAQEVARRGLITRNPGVIGRRVHVGSDVPCLECQGEVAKGAVPLGMLKAIGDCTCLNQCHCHFEVLGADGKWRWIGGRAA